MNTLILWAVKQFLKILTPELIKDGVDAALDWVETKVLGSASTVDDAIVLPLIKVVRIALDVPQDDD